MTEVTLTLTESEISHALGEVSEGVRRAERSGYRYYARELTVLRNKLLKIRARCENQSQKPLDNKF